MAAVALVALLAGGPLGMCLALAYGVVGVLKIAKVDSAYAARGETPPSYALINRMLDRKKARGQAPAGAKPAKHGMWGYAWQRWQAVWEDAGERFAENRDTYKKACVEAKAAGKPPPPKPSRKDQARAGWAWSIDDPVQLEAVETVKASTATKPGGKSAPGGVQASAQPPAAKGRNQEMRIACPDCGQTLTGADGAWTHPSSSGCPSQPPWAARSGGVERQSKPPVSAADPPEILAEEARFKTVTGGIAAEFEELNRRRIAHADEQVCGAPSCGCACARCGRGFAYGPDRICKPCRAPVDDTAESPDRAAPISRCIWCGHQGSDYNPLRMDLANGDVLCGDCYASVCKRCGKNRVVEGCDACPSCQTQREDAPAVWAAKRAYLTEARARLAHDLDTDCGDRKCFRCADVHRRGTYDEFVLNPDADMAFGCPKCGGPVDRTRRFYGEARPVQPHCPQCGWLERCGFDQFALVPATATSTKTATRGDTMTTTAQPSTQQSGEVTGIPSAIAYATAMASAHASHGGNEGYLGSLARMESGDVGGAQAAMEASRNAGELWAAHAKSLADNNSQVREAYSTSPNAANKEANTNE